MYPLSGENEFQGSIGEGILQKRTAYHKQNGRLRYYQFVKDQTFTVWRTPCRTPLLTHVHLVLESVGLFPQIRVVKDQSCSRDAQALRSGARAQPPNINTK